MEYPDHITVTRPGSGGLADRRSAVDPETGVYTEAQPDVLLDSACDLQSGKTVSRFDDEGDLQTAGTVVAWLPEGTAVPTDTAGTRAVATYGTGPGNGPGTERQARVLESDPFDVTLTLVWA